MYSGLGVLDSFRCSLPSLSPALAYLWLKFLYGTLLRSISQVQNDIDELSLGCQGSGSAAVLGLQGDPKAPNLSLKSEAINPKSCNAKQLRLDSRSPGGHSAHRGLPSDARCPQGEAKSWGSRFKGYGFRV